MSATFTSAPPRADGTLVAEHLRGDRLAGQELVTRFHARLVARMAAKWTFGDRDAAEEIAQEAWAKAFAALDRFDQTAPLWPWLRRLADNAAIDRGRKHTAHRRREVRMDAAALELVAPLVSHEGDGEERALLVSAMGRLDARHREALMVVEVRDVDQREAARLFGISYMALRKRLHRARSELRRAYEGLLGLPALSWLSRMDGAHMVHGAAAGMIMIIPAMIVAGVLSLPTPGAAAATGDTNPAGASLLQTHPRPDTTTSAGTPGRAGATIPDLAGQRPRAAARAFSPPRKHDDHLYIAGPTIEVPGVGVVARDGRDHPKDKGHTFSVPADEYVPVPGPLEVYSDSDEEAPAREAACAASQAVPDAVLRCRRNG